MSSFAQPARMCSERQRAASITTTLWLLAACMMAMYLALFVLSAAGRLTHPAEEFAYGESWLLDGARRVAQGDGLYGRPDQIPIMHTAYTPAYYVLVGWLQHLVGDGGYTTGRVVSLVATGIGTAALAWSVRRLTSRWTFGVLAAAFFLTQNMTVLLWAPLHRVDALAVGLTLCGLALATAGRFGFAAVVFLLALLTKQTFVVAPLAVAITLWPCRREFTRFVALLVGGVGASLVVGQWLTGGWFLWHTAVANGNHPDLMTFSALLGSFLHFNGLPLVAAIASFALPAIPGERPWRMYFVGCLATLPSLAKLGASSNYWLEISAAIAALLAIATCRLSAWPTARIVAPMVIAGSLFVAVPGYQASATEAAANIGEALNPPSPRYLSLIGDGDGVGPLRVDSRLVDRLAREPGDVLTDNSGLAVAAGKRIEYEFQIFQLLNAEGYWPEQPILDAVATRRFSLIALMHPLDGPLASPRWTPGLRAAMRAAYAPVGDEFGFWLYRPRA